MILLQSCVYPSESNLVIPIPISQTEKHTYLVFQSPANIYLRLKATVVQHMPRQACSGGNSVLPHSPRSSLPTGSCFDVPMLYSLALSSWLLALPRSSSDGEQAAATALFLGFHSTMRCDVGLPFSPDTAQNTSSVVTSHPSSESGQPVSKVYQGLIWGHQFPCPEFLPLALGCKIWLHENCISQDESIHHKFSIYQFRMHIHIIIFTHAASKMLNRNQN